MAVAVINTVNGNSDGTDHVVRTTEKVMVNGDVLFSVVGDIQLLSLVSECYTANNATASTLQYSFTTSLAQTQTLSAASATLASAIAGTAVIMNGAALTDAPVIYASGVGLNTTARGIRLPSGSLKVVIGVGSTTGTWAHYLRYEPLSSGSYAIAVQ